MTHIETDLVERLMALSRNEHDDLSIGEDAAAYIEELRNTIAELYIERDTAQSQLAAANVEIKRLCGCNVRLSEERDTAEARGYARGIEEAAKMAEQYGTATDHIHKFKPYSNHPITGDSVGSHIAAAIRNLP